MQLWQIQALELEASGLKHLDGFIHEHALYAARGIMPSAFLLGPSTSCWLCWRGYRVVHCDVKVENPRFVSDPACSSIYRDRHDRTQTR